MRLSKWTVFLAVFAVAHAVGAVALSVGLISALAIIETAALAWIFVIAYSRFRWWTSHAGQQVMSTMVFIALLTTVSILPTNSPGWLLRWVALVLLVGMAVLVLNQLRLLWQYGRTPKKRVQESGEGHGQQED